MIGNMEYFSIEETYFSSHYVYLDKYNTSS